MESVSHFVDRSKDVLGGEPVFKGTRVPVRTLFDYLESDHRLDEFLNDFPTVSRERAVGVLEFSKQTALSQAV